MMLGVLKGEPLVTKLAKVALYGVLPGAMIAALVYSPPDYISPKKTSDSRPPVLLPIRFKGFLAGWTCIFSFPCDMLD